MTTTTSRRCPGGLWIGLDLGTSHSAVAVWDSQRGRPKWLRLGRKDLARPDPTGKPGRLVPSTLLLFHQTPPPPQQQQPPPSSSSGKHHSYNNNNNNNQQHPTSQNTQNDDADENMKNDNHYDADNDGDDDDDDDSEDVSDLLGQPGLRAWVGYAAVQRMEEAWWNSTGEVSSARRRRPALFLLAGEDPARVSEAYISSVKRLFFHHQTTTTTNHHDHGRPSQAPPSSADSSGCSVWPLGAPQPGTVTPIQVAAILLRSMRRAADAYLQAQIPRKHLRVPGDGDAGPSHPDDDDDPSTIPLAFSGARHVVITVPATFTLGQRQALEQAARLAGFDGHVSTLTESTAAAMSYGLWSSSSSSSSSSPPAPTLPFTASTAANTSPTSKTILVFDMGGGTTDITIAQSQTGSESGTPKVAARHHAGEFQVLVTAGDSQLGGDDMDEALLQWILDKNSMPENDAPTRSPTAVASPDVDLQDATARQRQTALRRYWLQQCRRAKESLCGDIDRGSTDPSDTATVVLHGQRFVITRNDLEAALQPLLARVRALIQEALRRYAVLLNKKSPNPTDSVNPPAVAAAAADSSPDLCMDEVIVIGGASRVPAVRQVLRDLFPPPVPPELCLSVNPMSAVVQGAAIQAALESNLVPRHELRSAMMLDTLPYSIGVWVDHDPGGSFVEVLARDTTLPAQDWATFHLAQVRQAGVTIRAVEQVEPDRYVTVGEFTFLLHRLSEQQLLQLNGTRSIDVGMSLATTGEFVVSIFDPNDPEHIRKMANKERSEKRRDHAGDQKLSYALQEEGFSLEQLGLIVMVILLLVLYVFLKVVIFVPDPLTSTNR